MSYMSCWQIGWASYFLVNSTKLLPSFIKFIYESTFGSMQQFQIFMRQWKSKNSVLNRLRINSNGWKDFWDILHFKQGRNLWQYSNIFYWRWFHDLQFLNLLYCNNIILSQERISFYYMIAFHVNFYHPSEKLHQVSLLPALSYYERIFCQQRMVAVG